MPYKEVQNRYLPSVATFGFPIPGDSEFEKKLEDAVESYKKYVDGSKTQCIEKQTHHETT